MSNSAMAVNQTELENLHFKTSHFSKDNSETSNTSNKNSLFQASPVLKEKRRLPKTARQSEEDSLKIPIMFNTKMKSMMDVHGEEKLEMASVDY